MAHDKGGSTIGSDASGAKPSSPDDRFRQIAALIDPPWATDDVKPSRRKHAGASTKGSRPKPEPAIASENRDDGQIVSVANAKLPPGYDMTDEGLFLILPAHGDAAPPTPLWICSAFDVLGLTRADGGEDWALYISFRDPDGNEKRLKIRCAALAGDAAVVLGFLAAKGLRLSPKRSIRERLIECLVGITCTERFRTLDKIGWNLDGTCFSLPDVTFGDGDPVVFEGAVKAANFGEGGTFEGWKKGVAELFEPHDLLVLFVSLGFTGPMLDPLGLDGFGAHVAGGSSTGKTTLVLGLCSVYGGPDFMKSYRSTDNATEAVAAGHNNVVLVMDEVSTCAPASVAAICYMVGNGAGKTRMRSDGDLKQTQHFRLVFASTGEVLLADYIAQDGRIRAMAGHAVRVVDLGLDPESVGGVFDGPGDPAHFHALSRAIKAFAATHYGHAGPAFIAALVENKAGFVKDARQFMQDFVTRYLPPGADGQVGRVCGNFAAIAASGEMAALARILPFKVGRASEAAGRLFERWIESRGGVGSSEDIQAIRRISDFMLAHGASRFQRLL